MTLCELWAKEKKGGGTLTDMKKLMKKTQQFKN